MVNSLNSLVDNIINLASNQLPVDDFRLNRRQVAYWVNYYRLKILYDAASKGALIPSFDVMQDLGIVALTTIDKSESAGLPWGTNIRKAVLPNLAKLPYHLGLWVGLIDKQHSITVTSPDVIHWKRVNPFTPSDLYFATVINNILYVDAKCEPLPNYVNVRAVLADPADGAKKGYGSETIVCFDADTSPYPFPGQWLPDLTNMILLNEFGFESQMVKDETNNSKDDTVLKAA